MREMLLMLTALGLGYPAFAAPTRNDWQRELTAVCPKGSSLTESYGNTFECMDTSDGKMLSLNPVLTFSPVNHDTSIYRVVMTDNSGKNVSVPADIQTAFDSVAFRLNPEGYKRHQKQVVASKDASVKRAEKKKELVASFEQTSLSCPIFSGAKPKLYSNINDPWYEGGWRKVCVKEVDGKEIYHGPNIIWRADGSKAVESNYKDGQLDGKLVIYEASGRKERESHFKKGAQHGETTTWLANGDFKTTTFEYGKPHGREWGTINGVSFEARYERGIQIHREVKRTPANK